MAGLSMGGMQTRTIGLAHLDTFSHIGDLQRRQHRDRRHQGHGGVQAEGEARVRQLRQPGTGAGRRPGFGGDPKANVDALKEAGIKSVFYVSPETAHEWQTWRRSLHEFAPLLFQN